MFFSVSKCFKKQFLNFLRFSELFSEIEREISSKGSLGISSYGVSMTTLEEIFLKLGEEEEAAKEMKELASMSGTDQNEESFANNLNEQNGPSRMSNNKTDKDMTGFSFEAVQTKKSSWQMFKALVYVSTIVPMLTALSKRNHIADQSCQEVQGAHFSHCSNHLAPSLCDFGHLLDKSWG